MKNQTPLTKSINPVRNSLNRSSRSCRTVAGLLIRLALVCFALPPQAQAVCQEGCSFDHNTFLGEDALTNNTSNFNTAIGGSALLNNTNGSNNTASGFQALFFNTTGNDNTAGGVDALLRNTTGNNNTANGSSALQNNTTGSNNTADGFDALLNNTGSNNIAVGYQAGMNLTTGNNNIDIGALGAAGESKRIRIGKPGTQTAAFIAGISGAVVPTGVGVIVDTNGHLGTTTSSARYKENIKPMDKASEAILALRPVTFVYKAELDPDRIPQFGLVAEEVEKVDPHLVLRDEKGEPYSVRYEAVNAMLLNEFLKEHRKGEQQDRKIEELEATVSKLQSALKEQANQIQKVSAQVQVSSPRRASQLVANDP